VIASSRVRGFVAGTPEKTDEAVPSFSTKLVSSGTTVSFIQNS